VVTTLTGNLVAMDTASFDSTDPGARAGDLLMEAPLADLAALETHPSR
jgi:hypothetical protein